MRRKARVDGNHRAICDALVDAGAVVLSLAGNGHGCPDLLVGWRGWNVLFEVKPPNYLKHPSGWRKATRDAQERFKLRWTGQYAIVTSPEDAIAYLERLK
jgi:hypothetical protein